MKRTIYKNCNVNGNNVDIEVVDGKFTKIGKVDEDGIDLGGYDVFPGLVDIHCHGANGYSIYGVDDSEIDEGLRNISIYYAKNGITTWYPTTASPARALEYLLSLDLDSYPGANIAGLHLEGPYISPKKAGAINPDYMRVPNAKDFESYEKIKYITVAPELDGAIDYITTTRSSNSISSTSGVMPVSMTHEPSVVMPSTCVYASGRPLSCCATTLPLLQ